MATASLGSFLASLRQSQLVGDDRLAEIDAAWDGDPQQSPLPLVRQLLASGELTEWQARFLLSGQHRLHISRYVLVERLGRDYLGDHFRARHIPLDRFVDLQILPPELFGQPLRKSAFLEHAQRVATLDHPAIVHVFDVDCEGRRYFIVSEHVVGCRVDRIAPGELTGLDIARLLADVWSGLAHAHERSIVHGRLSLTSLVRRVDGSTVVRDLALAPLLSEDQVDESGDDAYSVTIQPVDDVAALGRLGQQLLTAHGITGTNPSEQVLAALVERIGKSDATTAGATEGLRQRLTEWISQNTRSSILADHSLASSDVSLVQADVPDQPSLGAATSRPATAARRLPSSRGARRARKIALGLAVVTALLVAGAAWWLVGRLTGDGTPLSTARVAPNEGPLSDDSHVDRDSLSGVTDPDKQVDSMSDDRPPAPRSNEPDGDVVSRAPRTETPADVSSTSRMNQPADDKPLTESQGNKTENAAPPMPPTSTPEPASGDAPSGDGLNSARNASPPAVSDTARDTTLPSSDPFVDLPEAFELPPIDPSLDPPYELGRVHVAEGYLLGLELVSSPDVARTPTEFLAEPSGEVEKWLIMMSQRAQPTRSEIASIWKDGDQLRFAWSPAAGESESAANLANCVLRLISSEASRTIPLRRTILGPRLAISDKDSQVDIAVAIPAQPNLKAMVVEILPFEGEGYPEHSLDGDVRQIRNRDQSVTVRYAKPEEPALVAMRISASMSVRMTLRAALFINDGGDGIPFRASRWNEYKAAARTQSQQLQLQLEEMKAYVAPDGQKLIHRENTKKTSDLLDEANKLVEAVNSTDAALPKIFATGIEYRIVFQLADGVEIVLVDSRSATPPEEANSTSK